MRPNQRSAVVEAALAVLDREGGAAISYEATAAEAGLSKAGVLYHFPSRDDLVTAVVAHVATRWDDALRRELGCAPEQATPAARIGAYVRVAVRDDLSRGEFAVFADALHHPRFLGPWEEVFEAWFDLDDCADDAERGRLSAARFAADGIWVSLATGLFPPGRPGSPEHDAVVAQVLALVGGDR